METRNGPRPPDLTHLAQLAQDPVSHHIFHALRVIEASFPDAARLGETKRPREEAFRFGQEAELAFPPSTIAEFQPPKDGQPGKLVNRFFGLFGPHGPLPLHLTEYARDRFRNHRDPTFVHFADMLTHRMLGLFYRAWVSGQPAPSFDRPDRDPVERRVAAIGGFHADALQGRDAMPDLAKRHFAGLFGQGVKNPEGLMAIVSHFFQVPVRMQEFVGSWLGLEPGDRWQLGASMGLGQATSVGDKVWSRASKFRLRIGPLSLADYTRLLPGSPALDRLEAIVRNYAGDVLDWDVNLVLARDEVPRAVLGQTTALGHTSWIGTRTEASDADDLYVVPPSAPAALTGSA